MENVNYPYELDMRTCQGDYKQAVKYWMELQRKDVTDISSSWQLVWQPQSDGRTRPEGLRLFPNSGVLRNWATQMIKGNTLSGGLL